MSSSQLTLPEHPSKKSKKKINKGLFAVVILQIAILSLLLLPKTKTTTKEHSYEYIQKTALKLEEMGLRKAASQVWLKYLQVCDLSNTKLAALHLRIAKLLQNDNNHIDAISHFVTAQKLGSEKKRQIAQSMSESLQQIKRFQAMENVLKEQVEFGHKKQSIKVLAQIGKLEITEDDLQKIIEEQIALKTNLMRLAFPEMAHQNNNFFKEMHKQYDTPKGKQRALQEYLFQEVLWRKALEDELHEQALHHKKIKSIAKKMLVDEVLQREIKKQIVVLPEEIRAFFQQNTDKFNEPAFAKITLKSFADEESAQVASLDDKEMEQAITVTSQTTTLEPFGDISKIISLIFTQEKPQEIHKVGEQIIRLWVHQVEAQKKKTFEEVQEQIRPQIYQRKYQAIMKSFMEQLYTKHKVQIYASEEAQQPKRENK
ncbi:hypothetical protein [Candidatus Uabimicrobium sp. HlEnr_7]|uniref:hypothetical protein n=1 Tax=Candidatus Uabimicrobium helgolandensis TaxID=3095367 RepID=UPI003558C671